MKPVFRIIVNCGPCEDYIGACIASLRSQSSENWEAYVTIDPAGDSTPQAAELARGGDPRIHTVLNPVRRYAMCNLISGVERSAASPEDVMVVLDGDDWFATPRALEIIANTYQRYDCWATYGSWISNDPEHRGMPRGLWPAYPEGTTRFREVDWLGTAVRTWKRWLWDCIDDADFRDAQGNYLRVTEDQAVMFPVLEMCGTARARHIPDVLMIYNRTTPHACGKLSYGEMLANSAYLRTRRPYLPLSGRLETASIR